jgi:cytochrome c553
MTRVLLALVLCAPLFALAQEAPAAAGKDAFVQGDAAAGATKATACFACHGPGGNGAINPQWPKLAGQHASYIAEQIKEFVCNDPQKCDERKNPVMYGQAMGLTSHEQDMHDIAAFFASQKPVPGVASPDSVAIAQPLFRAGDPARGLPACAACHGATGAGNAAAQFPRIGGQNQAYAAGELHLYAACAASDFKNCDRGATGKGRMMSAVAAKLKENEIQALSSYISGLQ